MSEAVWRVQLDWWRRELGGAPVLMLPTDAPRPAAPSVARCGWLDVHMEAAVVARLEAMAVQCGATMFMLLLGALQLLLCAHGRTDDVTVLHSSRHADIDRESTGGSGAYGLMQLLLCELGRVDEGMVWLALLPCRCATCSRPCDSLYTAATSALIPTVGSIL